MALTLRHLLHRALWYARRHAAQRLGWSGAAGIGLIVFTLAFEVSIVRALDGKLIELRGDAERLHHRYRISLAQPGGEPRGAAQQLDTFYEFFPALATLPHWLLRLYAAADRHDLALDNGLYQLHHEKGRRLARYQITLPVTGKYEQIRGFVSSVLQEIPALAVEDIALRRETIGSTALDASIRFTLFVRTDAR